MVRMNRQYSATREAMTGKDSWLLILFRSFQTLCIVSRSPFRSISCTLHLKVAKWNAKIQTSAFLHRLDPPTSPREVLYRDPYGLKATRVGEAANPGPSSGENSDDDQLDFAAQLDLEEQYHLDFADSFLPDPEVGFLYAAEEAGEPVHPRPPREAAPGAATPQRPTALKNPAEEGQAEIRPDRCGPAPNFGPPGTPPHGPPLQDHR